MLLNSYTAVPPVLADAIDALASSVDICKNTESTDSAVVSVAYKEEVARSAFYELQRSASKVASEIAKVLPFISMDELEGILVSLDELVGARAKTRGLVGEYQMEVLNIAGETLDFALRHIGGEKRVEGTRIDLHIMPDEAVGSA